MTGDESAFMQPRVFDGHGVLHRAGIVYFEWLGV